MPRSLSEGTETASKCANVRSVNMQVFVKEYMIPESGLFDHPG